MRDVALRYYVRAPDGAMIAGFDLREAAAYAALEYGDGALLVDTLAQAYHPMAEAVNNEALAYIPIGGWDSGRFGLERDLIEAIKKGHAGIVHAFLAKGAQPNATDAHGGPALVWAAAGGVGEIVALLLTYGADRAAQDSQGTTAATMAEQRGHAEILELLLAPVQDAEVE